MGLLSKGGIGMSLESGKRDAESLGRSALNDHGRELPGAGYDSQSLTITFQ